MATGNSDSVCDLFLEACEKGDLDKVNTFLEFGVDPNVVIENWPRNSIRLWDALTPLLAACNKGHLNIVKALLKSGANPNVCVSTFERNYFRTITPLLAACRMGSLNIVEALLQAKANPNGVNKKCQFPLMVAAYTGRADIIRSLVQAGAHPNKRYTASYFDLRIINPSCDVVEILLKHKANPNTAITKPGSRYITPLLAAICDKTYDDDGKGTGKIALHFASNKDVVKALLEADVNPNAPDDNGMTPLLTACLAITYDEVRAVGVIKLLLQYGADLNSKIQSVCDEEQLELYGATVDDAHGRARAVKIFELDGATHGEAALYSAIVRGFSEAVEVLLTAEFEGKISPDVTYEKFNSKTPLIIACDNRHAKVVLALIKCRANPNLADNDGNTPLIVACCKFSDNIAISVLLEANASLTKSNKYGVTPLIAACEVGRTNVVTKLLECEFETGAKTVNLSKKCGKTPLIIASKHGHCEIMSLLLEGGADLDKCDNNGRTPLIEACRHNQHQAVSMLLNAGADPNMADHDGTTPLIAACAYAGNNYNMRAHGHVINNLIFSLLQAGADPNKPDNKGQTPLIALAASEQEGTDIISTLIQNGADPNIADKDGKTPLVVACSRSHIHEGDATISTLLEASADINKADNEGITPLIAALLVNKYNTSSYNKDLTLKQLLYQSIANIDINHTAKDGSTALTVAKKYDRQYVELLRTKGALESASATDIANIRIPVSVNDHTDTTYHHELSTQEHDDDDGISDDNASAVDSVYYEAVTKAMSEGSGDMKVSLVTLHGPPGAGKTSLKRLLLGEPPLPPKQQNSTPIMDQPARAITTSKVGLKTGSGKLERVNENELLELLAGHVQDRPTHVQDEDGTFSRSSIDSTGNINNTCTGQVAIHPDEQSGGPSSDKEMTPHMHSETLSASSISRAQVMSVVLKDLIKSLKSRQSNTISSNIFDMHWFHIIDSGGQPQFQDVLPLLFHAQSLHIVVIRLNEQLDEKPKFRYIHEGKEVKCLPAHLTLTNFQIIERTCQLAQASGSKQPPWVMVVGTHLDLIDDYDETLEEKNQQLKVLQDKYSDVIITKSEEEIIFSVNAMIKDGAQRQQYRDELQQMVINAPVVEEKFTVPVRWLVLEMEVSRMSTDGIVSIGDCYKVAENLRMTEEETNLALKYFTDIAIHLHYPSAIPHILFTQMKPVVDRLSALISTSFTHSKLGPAGARKKLKDSGLFNKKDLHKICEVGESVLAQFTNDNFLELLQHLHIAVHISEDDYFLPCALSLSDDSQSSLESPSCDPIVFSWDKK